MNDTRKIEEASGEGSTWRGRRRRLVVAASTVVVAVAVALAVVLTGDGDGDGDPAPSATATAPSATATAPPPSSESTAPSSGSAAPSSGSADPADPADPGASPVAADELPTALPAVALTESVVVEEVRGSLVSVEAIDAQATGRGNVAGPALRVTVRIQNDTGSALSLDEVSVNLAYGPAGTPASPIEDSSQRAFPGTLPAGESADGTYVFSVPVDQRGDVTIQVGYRAGAPIAVFSGPVD